MPYGLMATKRRRITPLACSPNEHGELDQNDECANQGCKV